VLDVIERYLDAAPRTAADPEHIGKFTLFRPRGEWKYYARPRLGLNQPMEKADVERVRERQRELGIREAFEWVVETTPTLGSAATAVGLQTFEYPLMVLEPQAFAPIEASSGIAVRILSSDDPDVAASLAIAGVAFGAGGTAAGPEGVAERDAQAAATPDSMTDFMRNRIAKGWSVAAAAFLEDEPVSVGMHQPVGDVSEVVGVGTLPVYRRRGLAAAVTSALVEDAMARGVTTIFLSAGSDDVARVYERIGFRRVGTAGSAERPPE
jgi:ribosomal protein S18 acetylase RimI-like enzyme